MAAPNVILGYHGCERRDGVSVIENPEAGLHPSQNKYDWLGHGIYFWENDPDRALEWAKKNRRAKDPFVVGAVIDLGLCLDLVEITNLEVLRRSYQDLKITAETAGWPLPENETGYASDPDRVRRNLDCAVVNFMHDTRRETGEPAFDTVRSPFPEGGPLYAGSGFMSRTHVQVCVCNHARIIGYFHPR